MRHVTYIAFKVSGWSLHPPELRDLKSSVCSVGYSAPHNKWYGWSHRATCGFGIGDMIFDENFGADTTPFVKHGSIRIDSMEHT